MCGRRLDGVFDLRQPILAEEHVGADEKGRNPEHAARHRGGRVVGKPQLDAIRLGGGEQAGGIETGSTAVYSDTNAVIPSVRACNRYRPLPSLRNERNRPALPRCPHIRICSMPNRS